MNAPTYVPMTVADFNLDGLCDFAVGVGDMVYVVTSAGLATPIIYQSWGSAEVRKILAADLDQDGRPDLAILTPSVLEIRRNTPQHGTWQFVFSASHSTTAGADELRPIDCDGDGCVDLMAASPTNLTMYSVVGAQFTALQVYSHSQANPKIDSGDIDNDGDVDATIFGNGTYQIARRIGTAAFNVEPQQTGGIARFLVDFDQDGDLDGICCGGGGSSIPDNTAQSTFLFSVNKGNGNFAPSWKVPGLGSERVAGFVDLDHDGDIDIVAGRCVYYLRGPLLAPPNAKLPSSAGGESYVVDIDGDGDPDIFTGFNGYSRNLGNGQFILASSITPTPPPNHIYVGPGFIGDFDGDGNPDNNIQDYFSNYSNAGRRLFRNAGGGDFVDGGVAVDASVPFTVGGMFVPNYPFAGMPADVDGDGDLDLVTRNQQAGTNNATHLWINQGNGSLVSGPEFIGIYVDHVADLTGDGIADLMGQTTYGTATVILPGLGAGAFGSSSVIGKGMPSSFGHLELMDLDGDGNPDFIQQQLNTTYEAVQYTNTGGGSFSATTLLTAMPPAFDGSSYGVWYRDLDGDGTPDLLWTPGIGGKNTCDIRRGNPSGGFYPKIQQVVPALFLVDVDGDGDDDAVGIHNSDAFVFFNNRFTGPSGGIRRQFGPSNPGSLEMTPTLGAVGPFRSGGTVEFRVTGGVGAAPGLIVLGSSEVAQQDFLLPGLTNYVDPWLGYADLNLSGTPGAPGVGTWSVTIPVMPTTVGITAYHQVFLVDWSSPSLVVGTNGLAITYGG